MTDCTSEHTRHVQTCTRYTSRVEYVQQDARERCGVSGVCLTVLAKAVKSAVLFSECLTGGLWRPSGVSALFLSSILSSSPFSLTLQPHICLMPHCLTSLSNLFFFPCLLFLSFSLLFSLLFYSFLPPSPGSVLPPPAELREGWYHNVCVWPLCDSSPFLSSIKMPFVSLCQVLNPASSNYSFVK